MGTNMSRLGLATMLACVIAAEPAPASAEEASPAATGTVSAVVGPLRNAKGSVGCRLFKSSAGFPEAASGTIDRRVAAGSGTVRCVFGDLPPGTYAVSVIHDENDNRRLDKNFLGIPTEGYGVSNNHTYAMSAPRWEESKFVVERGKDVSLAIGLRY